MFDEKVVYPQQFPVHQRNRKSTDVCCTIIGAIFALTMFIVACTMWNRNNFINNFFNHRKGLGGKDCDEGYYVYSSDPHDYSDSRCVRSCPSGFMETGEYGLCLPQDQEARNQYLSNPKVSGPFDYHNFRKTLGWTALTAVGLGLLWMVIQWCLPKLAPIIAHIGAILTLIALGILLLVLWDKFWSHMTWLKILVAIFCFLLALILLVMLCMYANERKFQGLFLDYGKRFLSERPATFAYIPLFMLLATGLVALIVWQHSCFSSSSGGDKNFFNFGGSFWKILNILQFIWAFQFLRDAFNFCVSGAATDWYWLRPQKTGCYAPYQRLLCNHWGSVVGGSFLNAFFTIPRLIMELLICHPQACCPKLGTCCYNACSPLTCFFDLIRQDAYSYINMSGIPFCNAARQCKKINESSPTFVGSHSPMGHYKFAAHVFLVSLLFLMTWFILRKRVNFPNFWHYALLITLIYMCVTWFIDIHAAAAQGIQTSYLAERQLEGGDHNYMQRVIPSFRQNLQHWERRKYKETDGFL